MISVNIFLASFLFLISYSTGYSLEFFNQKYDSLFFKAEDFVKKHSPSKEVLLCTRSLPQNTRYFLYRRYVDQLIKEGSKNTAEKNISKYALMSYLACRESGGLGVALSAHGSEAKVSYYGHVYSALKRGIREMIAKRFKHKRKNYFSITTNVGLFQISIDQVDDVPDRYDPDLEIHRYFSERVRSLAKMSGKSLVLSCGTAELFDFQKEPELLMDLRETLKPLKNSSELEQLSQYAKLQTLCPALNFELAKKIHDLKGAHYFGPLSNKRNSRSCGTSFSLCAPIFRTINALVF